MSFCADPCFDKKGAFHHDPQIKLHFLRRLFCLTHKKVNVLPIEGDGTKINPNYQVRLSSAELADGKLDKEPSRIIITDITTIDKARLGRRIGRLTPECLAAVEKLLKHHLEL